MNIYTDMADELFRPGRGTVPSGVQVRTASSGPIRLTRVQITRQGLARPAGRYSTLETPSLAALDRRDERLISAAAAELRAMLPAVGLVLWWWAWATGGSRWTRWAPELQRGFW